MAKKNTSVNLEEDILDYIDKYRESNALSSRNKALERIILKFQSQEKEIENLRFFESLVKNGGVPMNNINNMNKFNIDNDPNIVEEKQDPISKKGSKFKNALEKIE